MIPTITTPSKLPRDVAVTRMTSKGQVTVPKRIREKLRVNPGDKVDFIERDGEVVVRRHFDAKAFRAALDKWTGYLPNPEGKSVDEIIREMRDG